MTDTGVESRRLAIAALVRIDREGAYANLVLPHLLEQSSLDARDRGFVTELVYGATRMRRAVDYLTDRFVERDEVDPSTRAALRIGAYQLHFLETPPHAAVDTTVAATPKRTRGFVNAILRRVAESDVVWPNDALRLSYPDWMIERLQHDLGERALPVLEAMNRRPAVTIRADGYRQDLSSTEVATLVPSTPGLLVLDVCAAPGGKATQIAGRGATVVASDIHEHRAGLVREAARTTGTRVPTVVADARKPPFRSGLADAVLVDAPCSGLGALRRRPDARWRIQPADLGRLAELQYDCIDAARHLLRAGGELVYSVCTLTDVEFREVDDRVAEFIPELEPLPLASPWEPWGRGGRLLPDTYDGDGMMAIRYAKRDGSRSTSVQAEAT